MVQSLPNSIDLPTIESATSAERRYEFVQEELIEMGQASPNHIEIVASLTALLNRSISNDWRFYPPDTAVYVSAGYVLPDGVLVKPPAVFVDVPTPKGNVQAISNPVVIFEVLSPSTRDRDLGSKFEWYSQIDTCLEYFAIEQGRKSIRVHRRTDVGWLVTVATDVLKIESAEVSLSFEDIYKHVQVE